jgi:DNA adenine methylase
MKYMGSKSRIAKDIVPIIQSYIDKNNIRWFVDLFCGGCNIIDKISAKYKVANDINPYLIALFKHLKSGGQLLPKVPKKLYDDVRSNPYNYKEWEVGCVGFLASYNGRFFDGGYAKSGYEGERLRDYYREASDNIMSQMPKLQDVQFTCNSYEKLNIKNAVIYCDIPYKDTKQYGNSKNFDYDKFWQWCRDMSKINIVIISELSAPSDFKCIWEHEVLRSIKSTDKSRAIEKLFILENKEIKND